MGIRKTNGGRALALSVNALALWTEANFFVRNWSNWHENQSFGYGLLLLASTLAIIALAWPPRLREPSRETLASR